MWTCPTCGEQHEDQFDTCWKCAPPLADTSPSEEEASPEQEYYSEEPVVERDEVPRTCLRCEVPLQIIGFENLRRGVNLFSWPPSLEAWKCPRCKRVELYASEN